MVLDPSRRRGEGAGEEDVHELGLAVAGQAEDAVAAGAALEVVEAEASELVRLRRQVHDPSSGRGSEAREQQVGEQERAEVVHGQHHVVAFRGLSTRADRHAGVVHEQVDGTGTVGQLGGGATHVALEAEIAEDDLG